MLIYNSVKPVINIHSKRTPKIGFQDRLLLNAGHKYCRMLQGEHSAILLTVIQLQFVIKVFVLSIFKWPLKTGFTEVIRVYVPENVCHFKELVLYCLVLRTTLSMCLRICYMFVVSL